MSVNLPIIGANVASFNTNGDNTIIAGSTGKIIRVYGLDISGATATVINIKDGGSTTLSANLGTKSSFTIFGPLPDGRPLYECASGNDFIINLGAGNAFAGRVWYSQT